MDARPILRILALPAAAAIVFFAGCGRSDIDARYLYTDGGVPDVKLDVSPDAPPGSCDALSCPTGCCDASGTCQPGDKLDACGLGGQQCSDCASQGFDYCDPKLQQCATQQPSCSAVNCPTGCCLLYNNQEVCVTGTSSVACGSGGQACADCSAKAQTCDWGSHACVTQPCGPNNCKGCCSGNTCVPGSDVKACGLGGLACTDCSLQNAGCDPQSGQCTGQPPKCDSSNCNGCCAGDVCMAGNVDGACGVKGALCQDCTQKNDTCSGGTCTPKCNSQTCAGCCDQNQVCYAGFTNSRCGSGGNSCSDCAQTQTTCNTQQLPRQCNPQNTCPTAYGGCGQNVTTPVVGVAKGSCSTADLQDAKSGCSSGYASFSCQQFYQTIAQTNPSCAKCLAPFAYDLQDAAGIYDCVSPYVTSSCNHATGCATDCEVSSCDQCPVNSVETCRGQVRQGNGQCQGYFTGTQCVLQPLVNQASFCNPFQYQGNYGSWLAGVGAHYCH